MNRATLFLILLALGTIWGATIPLTKIAVSTGHHPFGLIFWQFAISAALLGLLVLIRGSRLVFDRAHILFFGVIAMIGTLLPNSISYYAAFHLPAGVMALIIALVPMFSLLVALSFRLERFQPVRLLGVLLGAAAIALIVLPQSSLPDPAKAVFVLIALATPFCYGIEGNYLAVYAPRDTGPFVTLFGASLVGVIVSLALTLATGTFIDPTQGIGKPELALIVSSMLHVLAYGGYIWMVSVSGAVFSAQVSYIVTPAGILISMAALGEKPSVYIWAALGLLLVGLTLVQPRRNEESETANVVSEN